LLLLLLLASKWTATAQEERVDELFRDYLNIFILTLVSPEKNAN